MRPALGQDLRVDGEAEAAAAGDLLDIVGDLDAGADGVVAGLVAHGGEEHGQGGLARAGHAHDQAVRLVPVLRAGAVVVHDGEVDGLGELRGGRGGGRFGGRG